MDAFRLGTGRWSAFGPRPRPRSAAPPAFDPRTVPGLVLWLKADAGTYQDTSGTTPAAANGAPVALWQDQSGSGNHATQSSAGSRPALATGAVNGLPALTFDGSASFLTTPSLAAQTVFVVVNHTDGASFTNYRRVLDQANGGPPGGGFTIYGTNADTVYNTNAAFAASGGGVFYINGTAHTEATPPAAPLINYRLLDGSTSLPHTDPISIGTVLGTGSQVLLGHVAEVLVYDNALSGTDRAAVESYLTGRFAIP